MKILELLGSWPQSEEDSLSISFRKKYQVGDLKRIFPLYSECLKNEVSVSVQIDYRHGNVRETIVSNFRLRHSGIAALIESLPKSHRGEWSAQLAIVRSVEKSPSAFVTEFETRLGHSQGENFEMSLFLTKAEIANYFTRHYGDYAYDFWLRLENFKRDLSRNPRRFLRKAWSDKFPMVIALDLTDSYRYKFCRVVIEPKKIDAELVPFGLFSSLAKKALEFDESLPFLLSLTFAPLDNLAAEFATSKLGIRTSSKTDILKTGEAQLYDFKERISDVPKTVASFANACGGLIIYGLSNDGRIANLDRERDLDTVSNSIADGISPLVRYETVETEVAGKFIFSLIVLPPRRGAVYTLNNGQRPFRYHSTTKYFRYDSEIRKARATVCALSD